MRYSVRIEYRTSALIAFALIAIAVILSSSATRAERDLNSRTLRRTRVSSKAMPSGAPKSLSPAPPAGPFTVNTTNDTHAVLPAVSPLDSSGNISLRSAIEAANDQGGTTTINVPPGTYNLSISPFELQVGSTSGENISIVGTGTPANTIVHQTVAGNRVFDVDFFVVGNVTVSISNVTISGGEGDLFGGGGIVAGGTSDLLTVSNCVITNNSTTATNNGGGISFTGGGDLVIQNGTVISNNTATQAIGGGVIFDNGTNAGSLTITNSTISGNTASAGAGAGQGGGIFIGVFTGSTATIARSVFANNSAQTPIGQGGGIYIASGVVTVNFSRIFGNTAASGSGVFAISGGTTVDANNNWWGCNAGPGSGTGCSSAVNGVQNVTVTSWLQLRASASPNAICTGATSTITADIFGLNGGGTTAPSNLVGLPPFPVPPATIFHNAVLGTLSGASTQVVDGMASATFTAGSTAGAGGADATADNQTQTAAITVNANTATTDPADQAVCQGATASFSTTASGAGPFHYAWTLDGSPFGGDTSSINVPTASLSVGNHTVAVTTTGTCGSDSQSATLTVQSNTSTTKPNDQSVCAGSTASFSTTASGTGPFTFVWKKGATVLHTGDLGGRVTITSGSSTSSLTISNVQSTDAGTYSVETTGSCGTATQSASLALDSTPPTITCPSNITVEPTCPSGAVVTYATPVGMDNCSGATTTLTAGLASGSVFPIGTTTVTYTVTDTSGNSASCSFTVTVKTPAAAIQDLINSVQALINQGVLNQTNGQGLINKLQSALNDLNNGNTARACDDLDSFIDKVQGYIQHGTLTSAQGQPLIDLARNVKNTLGCNGTSGTCT